MTDQRAIGIPEPTNDPQALWRTCMALKEAVEVLQGIRGNRPAVTQSVLEERLTNFAPADQPAYVHPDDITLNTVRIESTLDAAAGSTGHGLQVGLTSGPNVVMDNNEIMARNNGAVATLHLNADGGQVVVGTGGMSISNGVLSFNNVTADKIYLWSTTYGLGVESGTMYFLSGGTYRWYTGTAADGGATDSMQLDTSGNLVCQGNVTAGSDARYKKNLEVIPDALEKVNAINGYTFERTDREGMRQTGVVAQEVEPILPEVVLTDEHGMKSVAYGQMVGLLIEAIKELNAKVERLAA